METIKVDAKLRTRYTKGDIKKARREGRVPGAVFGKGLEPFLVEVSTRSIVDVLRSEGGLNTLVELSVAGSLKKTVIISDLDRDPITRGLLHVGFHNIAAGELVHTQLPVRLIGVPEAVTRHEGMIDQTLETLDVKGESGSLPSHIDVDVTSLKVGDNITVGSLPKLNGIEVLTHDDVTIVSVLPVTQDTAAAAAETPVEG